MQQPYSSYYRSQLPRFMVMLLALSIFVLFILFHFHYIQHSNIKSNKNQSIKRNANGWRRSNIANQYRLGDVRGNDDGGASNTALRDQEREQILLYQQRLNNQDIKYHGDGNEDDHDEEEDIEDDDIDSVDEDNGEDDGDNAIDDGGNSLFKSILSLTSRSSSGSGSNDQGSEEKAKEIEDIVSILSDSFSFSFDDAIETLSEKGMINKQTASAAELIHQKRNSMIASNEGVEMNEDAVGTETVKSNWKHEALSTPIRISDLSAQDSDIPKKKTYPSWYKPGTKYFIYQTSGGISNQRKIMEWALMVSKVLNRTCILPPAAPHTTMYYNYEKVQMRDLMKMSDLIEIEQLRKITPVLVVEKSTFKDFVNIAMNKTGLVWTVLDRSNLQEKRNDPWTSERLLDLYGNDPSDVLFFSKGTMWQCFSFTPEEMLPVISNVKFHPSLRTTARMLSDSLGVYNALHIRFADGDSSHMRDGWLKPPHVFLSRMKFAKFLAISKTLYIATVPTKQDSAYFNRFKILYNVTFSRDLPQAPIVKLLKAYPERMHGTILGIIEQLICTRSALFLVSFDDLLLIKIFEREKLFDK